MLVVAVILAMFYFLPKLGKMGLPHEKDCKPHAWIYDETQELICEKCKRRPGYEGR